MMPETNLTLAMTQFLAQLSTRDEAKEKSNQIREDMMFAQLDRVVESNLTLNKTVQELAKDVIRSDTKLEQFDRFTAMQISNITEDVCLLDVAQKEVIARVTNIERDLHIGIGERNKSDSIFNMFQNNWYKVVAFILLSLPLIDLLYQLLKKQGGS